MSDKLVTDPRDMPFTEKERREIGYHCCTECGASMIGIGQCCETCFNKLTEGMVPMSAEEFFGWEPGEPEPKKEGIFTRIYREIFK